MVICKSCGAFMRFDPDSQKMKCDYCESSLEPAEVMAGKGSENVTDLEAVIYTCPQCGGEILWDDDTAATFCSYCGASAVTLDKRLESVERPEKIIPFAISKEKAIQSYIDTVKKALFAPDHMKQDTTVNMFRGIYMPYWCYDVSHEGRIRVRGTRSYRRGDYKHTELYDIDAQVDAMCSGISFDASASFSDAMSSAIAPFYTQQSKDFDEVFLSGFYADRCTVPCRIYEGAACEIAEDEISGQLQKQLGHYSLSLSKATGDGAQAGMSGRLCYFPVWFLAIRNKGGTHVSYAVVNGQTGKVAADLPVDYKKYILGSLLLALPIIFLLNTFLLLSPQIILMGAVIFAVLSFLMLSKQLDQIYTRKMNFDDKGIVYNSMVRTDDEPEEMSAVSSQPASKLRDKEVKVDGLPSVLSLILGVYFVIAIWDSFDYVPDELKYAAVGIVACIFAVRFALKMALGRKTERGKRVMYMPFSEKLPVLLKPITAVAAAVIVAIFNPVHDYYYYGVAIFSMVMVLLSFSDLVRGNNELCLRKPPQMNRRGGDM